MKKRWSTIQIAYIGLFAAFCYIGAFINIKFPIGGSMTMLHFGNVFCLIGALTLGGVKGGISAAIGMGIFDLTTPGFELYTFQTIFLKFMIAFIAALVYQKTFFKNQKFKIIFACSIGMLFNVIFDPLCSYITSIYLLNITMEPASILAKWSAFTTSANAIIAIVVASIIFLIIEPKIRLKKERL